jgi:hypothetical protein
MVCLLITFFISFIATTFIIRTQSFHGQFSSDTDLLGPQKFHKKIVPRIGGVAVALGITGASIYQYLYSANPEYLILLICSAPAFFIGLLEDLTKKVPVRTRFMVIALGALFASLLMSAQIIRLDILGIDFLLLYTPIAIAFTVFAISGVVNAYTIIDGFLFIEDKNAEGVLSVTGDMEHVLETIAAENRDIEIAKLKTIYLDSEGIWDGVRFSFRPHGVRIDEFIFLDATEVEEAIIRYEEYLEEKGEGPQPKYLFSV